MGSRRLYYSWLLMASHRSTGIICLGFWLNEGGVEFGAHPLVNGTTHVLKPQPATAIVENLSISQTRLEHLLLYNVLVSTIQSVYEYLDQWTETDLKRCFAITPFLGIFGLWLGNAYWSVQFLNKRTFGCRRLIRLNRKWKGIFDANLRRYSLHLSYQSSFRDLPLKKWSHAGRKVCPDFPRFAMPPLPSWRYLDYARLGHLQITASAAINLHGQ